MFSDNNREILFMNEKMNFTSENQMLISFLCILANLIIYC